jgi:hypothetical protein
MSYEYFIQAHLHQDSQKIPTESILSIFKRYIVAKDKTYIDLHFDESNRCTIYLDTEEPDNSGFMVSRPCGVKLGECLYEVMLLGNFVFFEPDGKYMITVAPSVEAHLPADMIETLGKPVVAKSQEDFLKLYHNNR